MRDRLIELIWNAPDCGYCQHRIAPFDDCCATNKRMSKKTAKKCPCYVPEKWDYEVEGRNSVGRAVEPEHFCSYGTPKERGGEK